MIFRMSVGYRHLLYSFIFIVSYLLTQRLFVGNLNWSTSFNSILFQIKIATAIVIIDMIIKRHKTWQNEPSIQVSVNYLMQLQTVTKHPSVCQVWACLL